MSLRILFFALLAWILSDRVCASVNPGDNWLFSSGEIISFEASFSGDLQDLNSKSVPTDFIGSKIVKLFSDNDIEGLLSFAASLQKSITKEISDSATVSKYYYYAGVCYLL